MVVDGRALNARDHRACGVVGRAAEKYPGGGAWTSQHTRHERGRRMARTVLVSGAGKGIGRAIALNLAAQGYNLFLLGRDGEALAAVAAACAECSVQAHFLAGDLCEVAHVATALAAAEEKLGAVALWGRP